MSSLLTFNSSTFLWSRTTGGIIAYPHGRVEGPAGPYLVNPITVPFDPIHETGGSFWVLKEGPNTGWLVSAWTNDLGYGSITVETDVGDYVPPASPSFPKINPLADWRILIKGMGGAVGPPTPKTVTINTPTNIYSTTSTGIIDSSNLPESAFPKIPAGGTYHIAQVTIPYDPIYGTGGSFYQIVDGAYAGKLISKWTNTLSDDFGAYGNITVASAPGFNRGPGATLATIYRPAAHLAGASLNYNAAGELHFTLLVDDPNINVPKPKKTHYAVEFYDTDSSTWVEVFAGLIWDMDATDTEVVFYGLDYLGLFQFVIDDRFSTTGNIDMPVEKGGSKYVKWTIRQIISEQLKRAISQPDSLVGFIEFGSVDSDLGKFRISAIYSTFRQTFDFCLGLINSYRAGSGKYTRMVVLKEGTKYVVRVVKDPGVGRDNLLIRYGQLAQGYRAIPFSDGWGTRVGLIGQDKTGSKVTYKAVAGATLEDEYGRVATPAVTVQTQDDNDLLRRANQAAVDAAALGRQISVGLKLGSFRPLEGYDLCDWVPVDIDHGAVHTMSWGSDEFGAELVDGTGTPISSGYWVITGLTWETYDDGHWETRLSLYPKNAVPYNPPQAEPDYQSLSGRGGAGVWACEFTGSVPDPSFVTTTLKRETAFTSINLPDPGDLDQTRGMIVFVGIAGRGFTVYGNSAPAGWTKDFDDAQANGGSLFVMHQVFDPVTNPIPSNLSPTVSIASSSGAACMVGFYTEEAGTPLDIRQTFDFSEALPGGGVGIDFEPPPSGESVLLAFVHTGNYWGATGPYRGLVNSPGTFPKENQYTHVGWKDVGINGDWDNYGTGRLVFHAEWGDGTYINTQGEGLICEYRIPYLDADVYHPPTATGNGPPNEETTKADNYTDLVSGIEYTYDWATGQWQEVPGTGNTNSGKYDFTFTSSDTWVVNHTLAGYPRVTVIDDTGAVVNASIVYNSTSQITVTFSSPVAGRVHLG